MAAAPNQAQAQENPIGFVLKATLFATEAHKNQRRKGNQEPYIIHPVSVANNISSIGGVNDPIVLAAALLHDTVEDTSVTLEDIEQTFGKEVRDIVAEVSDDKSLGKVERKKLQIEHALHASKGAKLVKLSDKLCNLSDLTLNPIWRKEIVQGYFIWAYKVIEALRGTNAALEAELDNLFNGVLTVNGETFPALPPKDLIDAELEKYYSALTGQ